MLGDDRVADRTVGLHDSHVEDVNQTDGFAAVGVDIDPFGAPGLVGLVARGLSREGLDLEEVEGDAVVARHGENRAAIALE